MDYAANILDNTATADGGGVMLRSGNFALIGGDVKGNSAGNAGGGVYVGTDGVMQIGDDPHVKDNMADGAANNILLPDPEANPLRVEELSDGSEIGVTTMRMPAEGLPVVFTSGFAGEEPTDIFFSDDPDYLVALDPSGEVMLGAPVTISFDPGEVDTIGSMDPVTWVSGASYKLPECYFHARNGEQFLGWGLDDMTFSPGEAIMVYRDLTLTALWTDTYQVWVGDTQVTKLNQDDVLGDGVASYNPDTQTLTLNDFQGIASGGNFLSVISAREVDLVVSGSGKIVRTTSLTDYGIRVIDGSLTLDGDFDIQAGTYGIYAAGDVTLAEGTIKVEVSNDAGTGIRSFKEGCTTRIKGGITLVDVTSPRRAFSAYNPNEPAELDKGIYVKVPEDGSLKVPHVVIEREKDPFIEAARPLPATDGRSGAEFDLVVPSGKRGGTVRFEAFDATGASVGAIERSVPDAGTTTFQVPIAPKNLNDRLVITYTDPDGQATDVTGVYETAQVALAEPGDACGQAMGEYGRAADNYLRATNHALSGATTSAVVQGYDAKSTSGSVAGISDTGYALVHNSRLYYKQYFKLAEDAAIDDYAFKVNGKKATPVASGSEYYVKVPAVKLTQWDDARTVTVTKGSESYSVTFDAMAYAQSKAGSSKRSLSDLAKSMHNHYQAALA